MAASASVTQHHTHYIRLWRSSEMVTLSEAEPPLWTVNLTLRQKIGGLRHTSRTEILY